MSTPLVSVVIATYQRPTLLDRAVESVINQTYENWELTVVNDDPATDVSYILPDDPRISYIHHDENRDLNGARNTGVRAASGDYIAFLDDDDEWKPTKLSKQVDKYERLNDTVGIVYAGTETMGEDGIQQTRIPSAEGEVLSVLLLSNVIPSATPLVRRECFDTVGLFDESFRTKTDLEMWIRIAREYHVAHVPRALAITYQDHEGRMSEDFERLYQGQCEFLDKFRDLLEEHPDAYAYRLHELGMYATYTDRRLEAAQAFLAALRMGRRDPLTAGYAFASLLPRPFHRRLFALRQNMVEHGSLDGFKHSFR